MNIRIYKVFTLAVRVSITLIQRKKVPNRAYGPDLTLTLIRLLIIIMRYVNIISTHQLFV